MKKFLFIFSSVLIVLALIVVTPQRSDDYDYLRLHIRANSNDEIDQEIKYEIKNVLVEYLSPHLANSESKDDAIDKIESLRYNIKLKCDEILENNGFSYTSNIKISNEYFPTRTYSNTTLESGYYDAVIIELGQAKGDNWWCVMYPPLCFLNKNENDMQINFKSKIVEWIQNIF